MLLTPYNYTNDTHRLEIAKLVQLQKKLDRSRLATGDLLDVLNACLWCILTVYKCAKKSDNFQQENNTVKILQFLKIIQNLGKTSPDWLQKPWKHRENRRDRKKARIQIHVLLKFLQRPWKSMVFRVPKTLVKQTKIKWKSWKFKKCSNLNSCIFWKVRVQGEMENAIVEPWENPTRFQNM